MGQGFGVTCKKCGYEFKASLGSGMLFPVVYQDTVKKMKEGSLGPEAKRFFEYHPNGVINCERVVAKCKDCGNYDAVDDLTMYRPKEGIEVPEEVPYIWGEEIKESYVKYKEYPHICSECGGKSKVYKSFEKKAFKGDLKCPKCDGMMGFDPMRLIKWD